jgi:hypothetical protein
MADFALPLLIAVSIIALVATSGTGTPVEKWHRFFASLRAKPFTWVLLGSTWYCCFVGFFWVMNFFVADTPSEALAKWQRSLPPGWEAGVMNHGEYFRWFTIEGHPLLFVGALIWLGASLAAFGYSAKRLGWTPNNRWRGP